MPQPSQGKRHPLFDRDPSDPARVAAELAQRGRMILDVATIDLEAAEAALGAFHPTSWHFRNALHEAIRSWDRLRAQYGKNALEAALSAPPLTVLTLGHTNEEAPRFTLIPIAGQTYRALRVIGTPLAPVQWCLTRLNPPLEDGPYYVCRLQDGSTQCDCAEWTYNIEGNSPVTLCKHLGALRALGWI
ncbi:hypothetical protein [Singulisphaera sp. PoT]|uniref:hypothetical protein n=1 Tax=Singulisphaera sp. PoT TaxID=3411797 RepID=UPI003BF538DD